MKISRTSGFKPIKKVEPGAPAVRFDRRSVKGKYRRRFYCDASLASFGESRTRLLFNAVPLRYRRWGRNPPPRIYQSRIIVLFLRSIRCRRRTCKQSIHRSGEGSECSRSDDQSQRHSCSRDLICVSRIFRRVLCL